MPEVKVERDRDGSRHADKYTITFNAADDVWDTGIIYHALRKLYVRNGDGELHMLLTIDDNGPIILLKPGYAHDFKGGNRVKLTSSKLSSAGTATCYVHIEWHS